MKWKICKSKNFDRTADAVQLPQVSDANRELRLHHNNLHNVIQNIFRLRIFKFLNRKNWNLRLSLLFFHSGEKIIFKHSVFQPILRVF